ncbi:MAG: hypothetical protein IRZ08_16200 [Frankia sp.]|nr:hypothetical protein [Frankia sp.]
MPSRTLDDLRALAAQVRQAEQALSEARRQRDAAIREVRAQGTHTVQEIADAAGVSLATAKIALRGTS